MDIKLDDTGDLEIIDGELSLTSGIDAIAQELRQRLLFFIGEWFLDTRLGVDWFGTALVKNPNWTRINQMIRSVAMQTSGIRSIRGLEFDFDSGTRNLELRLDAEIEDLTTHVFEFSELFLFGFQSANNQGIVR
jgi:hypothetical protein